MKNFMFNSNAKKKISITSALFSLLILFFALNCSFCGNLCSASLSDDNDKPKSTINFADDSTFNNFEPSRGEEKTTTEIKTPKEGEEENHSKEKDETDNSQEKKDEQESKGKDLCPFLCTIC